MDISIDPDSEVFPYIQLADQLRAGIMRGEWTRRIPSIQQLVRETGLAVETIRRAVKLLVDEGLVHTVPGRGTYITRP